MPSAEIMEPIKAKYEPRIMAILESIRQIILDDGRFECGEPFEMTDDEYSWWLSVYKAVPGLETRDDDAIMDIRFEMPEKDARGDAEDDDDFGVTFHVSVTAYGGQILGGVAPYNYTDQCWVWGEDEIEERFQILERMDWSDIVESAERALEIVEEDDDDDDE